MKNKVVLLTGVSSGIGLETAQLLIKENYKVYGISRKPFVLEGLTHIPCDVSNPESVTHALATIMQHEEQIDVVINNAGMGISGSIEHTSLDEAKKLFDINLFGAFLVSQAALPFMKAGAKIINIGSVAGALPIPFQAFYSASKAAIQSFSDALRMELKPHGIFVSVVLPGDTKTGFTAARIKNKDEGRYQARVEKSVSRMEKDEQNGMPALSVSRVILKLIARKKPAQRVVVGAQYKFLVGLAKILPNRFVNYVLYKMYG